MGHHQNVCLTFLLTQIYRNIINLSYVICYKANRNVSEVFKRIFIKHN